jgi:para-nitrobenzyl esterase
MYYYLKVLPVRKAVLLFEDEVNVYCFCNKKNFKFKTKISEIINRKNMHRPLLLLAILLITACSCMSQKSDNTIDINSVSTKAGLVSGITNADGTVKIFKGIPFAAPPVGDLRWKAPIEVASWEGIRKCDTFAASAMQAKPAPFAMWTKEFMTPEKPLSEDCLYLNIWTNAKTVDDLKPVIVWIHGGAFTGGSGSVPLYDGEEMAKKGVVFITINYRLGIFGFFAHPELSKESPDSVSGNYGILDQIAALKWVKENIHSFGGDPANVTIDGQSAGAFSVNALVVSPLAKGLFHKAIAQSGGMFGTDRMLGSDLANAELAGAKLAKSLKVNSIAELRALPAETLLKAGSGSGPIIDNVILPSTNKVFDQALQNDVPLLTGWNADEFNFGPPQTATAFRKNAQQRYGDLASEFFKVFPANNDEEANQSGKLISVLSFGWQNYRWAIMQSRTGRNKAWLYYFSHVPPGEPNFGAFHSAEFGYCLKTLKYWNRPFQEWDQQLAEIMSSYWVNFAKTGNPNGEGLPEWPTFDPGTPMVMDFGDQAKVIDLPWKPQLQFLDKYQEAQMQKN